MCSLLYRIPEICTDFLNLTIKLFESEARESLKGRPPHRRKVVRTMAGRLICLEGNISAGKTTLARELQRVLKCRVFFEPTTDYNPLLEAFYKARACIVRSASGDAQF
jgi:hypothetical protein